jgi:hypothetical protein
LPRFSLNSQTSRKNKLKTHPASFAPNEKLPELSLALSPIGGRGEEMIVVIGEKTLEARNRKG